MIILKRGECFLFCINPNGIDGDPSAISADVRIARNASNAVGIDVIMDSENNKCR